MAFMGLAGQVLLILQFFIGENDQQAQNIMLAFMAILLFFPFTWMCMLKQVLIGYQFWFDKGSTVAHAKALKETPLFSIMFNISCFHT